MKIMSLFPSEKTGAHQKLQPQKNINKENTMNIEMETREED